MQVRLKPLSPSGLDDIVIDDCMFPVGRYQPPFQKYEKTIVAHLSRRHARIFSEAGAVFIVDDGSSNGTKVNGKQLAERPIQLRSKDVITFGEKLSYRAEFASKSEHATTQIAPPAGINLTLIPARDEMDTLIIDRFPFLISKHGKFFGKYAKKFVEDVRFLSRRHAYFFIKGNELYIEDLGSTNGTSVNGKRLDEHAVLLHNGDTIEIGSDRFRYTVKLEKHQLTRVGGREGNSEAAQTNLQVTQNNQAAPNHAKGVQASIDETDDSDVTFSAKTTFVSSSTSFLDIFCIQEEADSTLDEEDIKEDDEPIETKPAKTAVGRFLRRAHAFFSQLRSAFAEDTSHDKRKLWLVVGMVCVIALVSGGIYMLGAAKREIKDMMASDNYEQSLQLANAYLETHPQQEEIQQLATEALIKYCVPQWVSYVEQRNFEKARELITETKQKSSSNKSGQEVLYVLEWVGSLEEFFDSRGGIDAPIVIFRQEQQIDKLLDWWENNETGNRRSMGNILGHSVEFKDIHARTFSNLRSLRNEKSIYLVAIEALKKAMQEKLDSGRAEELGPVFDKFERKYPKIKGMDKVRQDWQSFLALKTAIDSKDLRETLSAIAKHKLTVPPFKEKIEDLKANALPSDEYRERYSRASTAWRSGEIGEALDLLKTLGDSAWRELVTPELERKQKIVSEFKKLRQYEDSDAYQSKILAFYQLLNKQEDVYFLDGLEGSLKDYKDKLASTAEQAMEVAQKDWNAYRQAGGIGGLLRLEDGISSAFKQQAKRLSSAYLEARSGIQAYQDANLDYASERKELFERIKAEVRLQRRSLEELNMVLSSSLLQSKLQLIPEL